MKKGIIAGVVIILLLITVGGYFYLSTSKKAPSTTATSQTAPKKTVFSSIQEALLNHLSLSCDYMSGDVHTIAYVKNGMIRADITDSKDPSHSGSVIMKDKKIYYWNTQKTGFMMVMPEVTGTVPTGTTIQSNNGQSTIQSLEQYKQYCKSATVADTMFELPTDVKFTDESQMMRMMPSSSMPTGTSGTNYQQQMQQYMQQYHVTPQGQ